MTTDKNARNDMLNAFLLDMPADPMRRLSIGWLALALGSLVVAGLLTIVIVLSRTPYVQDIFPWVDLFRAALVVHVDLTVLVWFLSMAGVFWSINSHTGCTRCGWAALALCSSGACVIALSPFLGSGNPLITNYIPILNDPLFFLGLLVFGGGFLLLVVRGLSVSRAIGSQITGQGALRFGLLSALLAAVVALGALLASWLRIPETVQGVYYFELLFWGGGHVLQFVHIQLMLVTWLWLASVSGIASRLTPRIVLFLFAVGLLPVLLTPLAYVNVDIASAEHLSMMTRLMQFGGGLAAMPIGLVVLFNLVSSSRGPVQSGPERSALLASMLLFGVGGLIGFLIQGSNVTVPAHYHGSIVAVTLAYMGIIYHLLPLLGFRRPLGRIVVLQPWIYAGGQFLHVIGLAWSGGYGVRRKTAGDAQILDRMEEVAGMGLMGLGGLIAVIGGVLFLVIVFKAMWPGNRRPVEVS
ncbi:MAG: cbb3-type cytochrome c oxidase subunit I [Gammaproteobacteria bacterium]